jgi:hypothetical protein
MSRKIPGLHNINAVPEADEVSDVRQKRLGLICVMIVYDLVLESAFVLMAKACYLRKIHCVLLFSWDSLWRLLNVQSKRLWLGQSHEVTK